MRTTPADVDDEVMLRPLLDAMPAGPGVAGLAAAEAQADPRATGALNEIAACRADRDATQEVRDNGL